MNIKKTIKEIINPRFTIDEIENGHTKGGFEFKITALFFDDNKRHFPTKALGWIDPMQESKIVATWNQHGECYVNSNRIISFDLVRPTQNEIDALRPVFLGMITIILLLNL